MRLRTFGERTFTRGKNLNSRHLIPLDVLGN